MEKLDDLNSFMDLYFDTVYCGYKIISKSLNKTERLLSKCNHKYGRSDYFHDISGNLITIYLEIYNLYYLISILEVKYNKFYNLNK